MHRLLSLSALLSVIAAPAFAHPGHGASAFHSHGEWLALGLVALIAGLALLRRR